MKTCTKCKLEKLLEEFNWKIKKKGLRQAVCRECSRKSCRKYFRLSPKAYMQKTQECRLIRKQRNIEYARLYLKSHPCADCGQDDIRCLQFDHVRGKKTHDVTTMIQMGLGLDRIESEIAKCEIRCANCHFIKTWPRRWEDIIPVAV